MWKIVQVHGLWWAHRKHVQHQPEEFKTHGREDRLQIKGPYHCREYAEYAIANPDKVKR